MFEKITRTLKSNMMPIIGKSSKYPTLFPGKNRTPSKNDDMVNKIKGIMKNMRKEPGINPILSPMTLLMNLNPLISKLKVTGSPITG
jgi:hypothetical protein